MRANFNFMSKDLWCVSLPWRCRGIYLKRFPFSTVVIALMGNRSGLHSSVVFESHQSWTLWSFATLCGRYGELTHGDWFSWNRNMQLEDGELFIEETSGFSKDELWKSTKSMKPPNNQLQVTQPNSAAIPIKNSIFIWKQTSPTPSHPLYTCFTHLNPRAPLKTPETSFNSVVYFEIFDQESCHSDATKLMMSPPGERLQNIGIP